MADIGVNVRFAGAGRRIFTAGVVESGCTDHAGVVARLLHIPDALKCGPFTVAEAEAWGIRRQRLRRPNFTRLARGVTSGPASPQDRMPSWLPSVGASHPAVPSAG